MTTPRDLNRQLSEISKANPNATANIDQVSPKYHPLWSGASLLATLDNGGEVPSAEVVERLLPQIESLSRQTGTENNERVTALAWEAVRNRCLEMAAVHLHDPVIAKTYFGLAERADIALGRSLSRLEDHQKKNANRVPIGDRIAKNEFEREQFRQLRARGINV